MNYIRYHELEILIYAQLTLESILDNLSADLTAVVSREGIGAGDEYIYSMCIGNKVFDSMPPTGKISDSTGNIAANYEKIMWLDRKEVRIELKDEALKITIVLDKLGIAFRKLNSFQRTIVELYYRYRMTWPEIIEEIKSDRRYRGNDKAKEEKRRAVDKMSRLSRISIQEYGAVLRMVEENVTK